MNNIIKHSDKITKYNFGGKANSLFKLVNNNINVPKFFVITSKAYIEFLNFNNILLDDNRTEISSKIDKAEIPSDFVAEISNLWNEYNFTKVSVRSSATNEDGKEKSFAGQYETFLSVEKKDLLESIKKCWKSLYEENVIAYNEEDINSLSMNVIIQEMINPNYAGVGFSLDPTSNSKNYSVIEAVKGLGEQLVSGSITPSRFVVRRQTLKCDLLIGDIKLSDEIIAELESIILKIEKLYNLPVDIEWCILNDIIYILQARPITAFNISKTSYEKVISREKAIIEIETYYTGEYEGIKSLTRDLYYFKPLFIYDTNKGIVDVYYNSFDLEEDPNSIYFYMQLDIAKTKKTYSKAISSCKYLNEIIDNDKNFNYTEFIMNMITIYPFSSLGNLAGRFENISKELKTILVDFRNNYDYILYKANEYLLLKAKEKLPNEYKQYLNFLFIDEVFNNNLPTIDIIDKRKKGYVYFNDKLELTENINNWFDKNNITIESKKEQNYVKGSVAYSGIVKGKVCQIFKKEDFVKFQNGDILVTTMTTPKFTPILKKARAIVTDEGGITCHASIIARELKIPCIVGCKNATTLLKNGMNVEVNANEGLVVIL